MGERRYEISLWEEKLIPEQPYTDEAFSEYLHDTNDQALYSSSQQQLTVYGEEMNTIPAHYRESKLAVIGANDMNSICKATEPKLTSNINGSNTFTFKMYYTYVDNVTGEVFQNPFLNLLVNERRVKVYWPENNVEDPWYDFVIKKCEEDSSGKSITYTCNDLFINELAKTGFDIEFDNSLENNQGTAVELGTRTVDSTDWFVVGTDGRAQIVNENNEVVSDGDIITSISPSEEILQTTQEPVYEVPLVNSLAATNQKTGEVVTISSGIILVFYSCYPAAAGSAQIQFLYNESYTKDFNTLMVNNADCYTAAGTWVLSDESYVFMNSSGTKIFTMPQEAGISTQYRGKRYVDSTYSVYDALTDRYCDVYDGVEGGAYEGHVIYGYTGTDYNDVTTVENLLVNAVDFSSSDGWTGSNLQWKLYPVFDEKSDLATYNATGYLNLKNWIVYNSGLQSFSSYLSDGLQCGDRLIFRYKAYSDNNGQPNPKSQISGLKPIICTYEETNELIVPATKDRITYVTVGTESLVDGWYQCELNITKSATRSQIYNKKIGFFIDASNKNCWVEEVQLFHKVVSNGEIVCPNSVLTDDIASIYYYFYDKTANQDITNAEDLNYLSKSTTEGVPDSLKSLITPRSNELKKIRSITESKSNRFNILQDIAETFECWVRFHVVHDAETGRIVYEKGRAQKYITFVNEVGVDNGITFRYKTDLKSIKRTIESTEIVTKTIVTQNSNEYATDGFCTIARSEQNPCKDTFILNFDYYLENGILDGENLNKDLYIPVIGKCVTHVRQGGLVPKNPIYYKIVNNQYTVVTPGTLFETDTTYYVDKNDYGSDYVADSTIGYYYWLRKYNNRYDEITELLENLSATELTQKASLEVNEGYVSALAETISSLEQQITAMAAAENVSLASDFVSTNLDGNDELRALIYSWQTQKSTYESYLSSTETLKTSVSNLESSIEKYEEEQEFIQSKLKKLHSDFFTKYGHYIQEGVWTSEDYIDDTQYYLDALDIAYTSSRPKVSYSIDLLRLSQLEEYRQKTFNVGDICYLEDTEFFGYLSDGITPYHEKFLISELTCEFDSPNNDKITVQNYKTQFEDLFQRITATTQSLQYEQGNYARAANAISTEGTIQAEILQNSISTNQNLVIAARNESVYWDSTGLTVTDTLNANNRVQITSGGIFITTDGGNTWKNAVRGEGISTQYLTAGLINVNSINLYDGVHKTFRWDNTGINAYYKDINGINIARFVRFDQYGIYGLNGDSAFTPESEQDIWDNAQYALTWKGFKLRSQNRNGYISISSDNDFQVFNDNIERIKIGLLDETQQVFGISINDAEGRPVIYNSSDGNVYLSNTLTVEHGNFTTKIGAFNENETYIETSIEGKTGAEERTTFLGWLLTDDITEEDSKVYYARSLVDATGDYADPRVEYFNTSGEAVYPTYSTSITNLKQFEYSDIRVLTRANTFNANPTSFYTLSDSGTYVQCKSTDTYNDEVIYYVKASEKYEEFSLNPSELSWYEANDQQQDYYVKQNDNYYLANKETPLIESTEIPDYYYYNPSTQYYVLTYDSEIINANNNFIVYSDGSVRANNGYFKGEIQATSGSFSGAVTAQSGSFVRQKANGEFEVYARINDGLQLFGDTAFQILKYDPSLCEGNYYKIGQITQARFNSEKKNLFQKDKSGSTFISCADQTYDSTKEYYYENTAWVELTEDGVNVKADITGSTGTFTGSIYAAAGQIGGFSITTEDVEIDGQKQTCQILRSIDNSLTLNGTLGTISGGEIILSNKATIENYLSLGEAKIWNPNSQENPQKYLIESGNIKLFDNGVLDIGGIKLNGTNSTISDALGTSFQISPTESYFNNVTVSGRIKTAVYEVGTVQAVGGLMLFNTSYLVKSYSSTNKQIIVDSQESLLLNVGDQILFIDTSGKIISTAASITATKVEEKTITLSSFPILYEGQDIKSVIVISQTDSSGKNGLIIGVNSSNVSGKLLEARGITISEYTFNSRKIPEVFLGDLSSLQKSFSNSLVGLSGYGLYSQNVVLHGSLITQSSSYKYAGVNTNSGVLANIFGTEDQSAIIFWAGADENTDKAIQAAPFQVTEQGSIYASQGRFTASVISESVIAKSSIYSTDIYSARLHGWTASDSGDLENGKAAALYVYNTSDGICFCEGDDEENDPIISFKLTNNGMSLYDSDIIEINSEKSSVAFYGQSYNTNGLSLNDTQIYTPNYPLSIDFTTGSTEIEITTGGNKATFEETALNLSNDFTLGEKMFYQRAYNGNELVGYDLYVR